MGCSSSGAAVTTKVEKTARASSADDTAEYRRAMSFISQVPILRRLPKSDHPLLALASKPVHVEKGATIVKQGDTGSELYIIQEGEASVLVTDPDGPRVVATLKAGDYFGEAAVIRQCTRTATVQANTQIRALMIQRQKFVELGLDQKLTFPNRKAVGQHNTSLVVKEPSPKTPAERDLIASALKNADTLQQIVKMDEEQTSAMIDVSWKETVPMGTTLITEGDMQADYFYIVQSGEFEITQAQEGVRDGLIMSSKVVGTIGPSGSFGELALLYLAARAATVQAKVDSIVWVFDRVNFKKILLKQSERRIQEYVSFLNQVNLLSPMLSDEKRAMAEALVEMHFIKDDVIVRQGEQGTIFYILYYGEMSIIKDGVEVGTLAAKSFKDAKVFGERSLLLGEPRAATAVVTSETAKALVLDRDSFHMILGPLEEIIQRGATGVSNVKKKRRRYSIRSDSRETLMSREPIKKADLKFVALLGTGGFGAVELVEHVRTTRTYALKKLSKRHIVQTGMQNAVINERDILLRTDSPFVVTMYGTYRDDHYLYFLLNACLGGELHVTYNRKNLYGKEKLCKYYAAGVTRAFAHMHERKIIYRDLKPENLLLTSVGRLVVADMGLAKFCIGKAYSVCGTPDYFAPELIASIGHTTALDWWTLGILIFELMTASPPFQAGTAMQVYVKVQKGIGTVIFPSNLKGPCEKIIRDLLKHNPEERLCVRIGGINNIEAHAWYRGFDWHSHGDGTMHAPYHPKVKSDRDTSNFSAREQHRPPQCQSEVSTDDVWSVGFDMDYIG